MDYSLKVNFEDVEVIIISYLKEAIDTAIQFKASKHELKSYLYVLSNNMFIGDFKAYAKEKNLEHLCKKIYKEYDGF